MHERYLCNLVDALRLMIPAQMRGDRVRARTVRVARLKVSRAEAEAFVQANRRAKAQAEIVRRLIEAEELPASALPASALRALAGKDLVEIAGEEVRADAAGAEGRRKIVRPGADAGAAQGRLRDRGCAGARRRAVSAARRDRKRQDGGLHPGDPARARAGAHGHRAGAGDRIDAADGFMAARAVRRGRRRAALSAVRRASATTNGGASASARRAW